MRRQTLRACRRIWMCADCAVRFFVRWGENFADILPYAEKFSVNMTENMQAGCVQIDAPTGSKEYALVYLLKGEEFYVYYGF